MGEIQNTKAYKLGRSEAIDIDMEKAKAESDLFMRAYKIGYRDGKLGRKRIPHKTMGGWCCACEYDISIMEDEIRKAKKK